MKIIPHLWYTDQAGEAAEYYTSLIENGKINWRYTIKDTPSGNAELLEFTLANLTFGAISGGDYFRLNESISLMLKCCTKEEVHRLYRALIEGGRELMPLGAYDFSEQYVWLADRYGLNWQIMLDTEQKTKHHIDLCLLFDLEQNGKANEALQEYQSIFKGAEPGKLSFYDGTQPEKRAKVNYGELQLPEFKLIAMDHGYGGNVTFNEAFSLMVLCSTDAEIEEYWNRLSHVKEAERCGWLKDRYGVSWQIVPDILMKLYNSSSEEKLAKVNREIMKMKKLAYADLQALIED